jgi:hypothetical protein
MTTQFVAQVHLIRNHLPDCLPECRQALAPTHQGLQGGHNLGQGICVWGRGAGGGGGGGGQGRDRAGTGHTAWNIAATAVNLDIGNRDGDTGNVVVWFGKAGRPLPRPTRACRGGTTLDNASVCVGGGGGKGGVRRGQGKGTNRAHSRGQSNNGSRITYWQHRG